MANNFGRDRINDRFHHSRCHEGITRKTSRLVRLVDERRGRKVGTVSVLCAETVGYRNWPSSSVTTWEIILIALSLAMDAFAVALAVGSGGHGRQLRPAIRLSFHFGWFQFMMPVIGWWAGRYLERWIMVCDHWIAFALLAGVGSHMLWEARGVADDHSSADPTRGMKMVALSVATSIDALAVGVSLAMIRVEIWYPSVATGLVTGSLAMLGVHVGGRLHRRWGRRMESLGGVVLIGVGLRILLDGMGWI